MKLGFTGTQRGMTTEQRDIVTCLVVALSIFDETMEAHHGDCRRADEDFHNIASQLSTAWIVIHPPIKNGKRAFCMGDETREPEEYLKRNRNIVAEADFLIATPGNYKELKQGSGTWATWRYATAAGISRVMIFPDGTLDIQFS